MSLNKVLIIGFAGGDPKTSESGMTKVARLSVATSEKYNDKDITEWHSVVAFGKTAEIAAQVRKGQMVYVEGKIRTRSYEKDGATKYVTEILADKVSILERKEKNEQSQGQLPWL